MIKLFIVPPQVGEEGYYKLVTESGKMLDRHWCSNAGFAMGDLITNNPERVNEYKKLYGDFTVVQLDKGDLITNNPERVNEYERLCKDFADVQLDKTDIVTCPLCGRHALRNNKDQDYRGR